MSFSYASSDIPAETSSVLRYAGHIHHSHCERSSFLVAEAKNRVGIFVHDVDEVNLHDSLFEAGKEGGRIGRGGSKRVDGGVTGMAALTRFEIDIVALAMLVFGGEVVSLGFFIAGIKSFEVSSVVWVGLRHA